MVYNNWYRHFEVRESGPNPQPRGLNLPTWEMCPLASRQNPHVDGRNYRLLSLSLSSTGNGTPFTVRGEWLRCDIVNPFGVSRSRGNRRKLATSFKEMRIRAIIMGINLASSEPVSHTLLVVEARNISHRVPPTSGKQEGTISNKDSVQPVCIGATYIITRAHNNGWESGHDSRHMLNSNTCEETHPRHRAHDHS